jgi:hypothetical protein
MPLPKSTTPVYELELPSSKKKIKYRPFLVKEEKVLILALESNDIKQITEALKNVLTACIISKDFNIESLSTFDIEYLFLNVRGKSVGEVIEVTVTCPDDGETKVDLKINIDDIKVKESEDHSRDIDLGGGLKLRMKYPSLKQFVESNFTGEDLGIDEGFSMIGQCIEQVYNEEESWAASDCTKEELEEFVGDLTSSQFQLVEKFFSTMPKLSHTIKVTNPKTKKKSEHVLEGLASFFA